MKSVKSKFFLNLYFKNKRRYQKKLSNKNKNNKEKKSNRK